MAESNWAEQAEAVLKRRRAVLKEFAKLDGEARAIAELNAEASFKAELRKFIGPWPQAYTITNTIPCTYTTAN